MANQDIIRVAIWGLLLILSVFGVITTLSTWTTAGLHESTAMDSEFEELLRDLLAIPPAPGTVFHPFCEGIFNDMSRSWPVAIYRKQKEGQLASFDGPNWTYTVTTKGKPYLYDVEFSVPSNFELTATVGIDPEAPRDTILKLTGRVSGGTSTGTGRVIDGYFFSAHGKAPELVPQLERTFHDQSRDGTPESEVVYLSDTKDGQNHYFMRGKDDKTGRMFHKFDRNVQLGPIEDESTGHQSVTDGTNGDLRGYITNP